MYLAHYGLKRKPFDISPDPEFLWLGERHQEALAALRYGIIDNKGFLLLTGDIGTGKTVLLNHLIKLIDTLVTVAVIPNPEVDLIGFFNILSDEFRLNKTVTQKGEFLFHFKKFLMQTYDAHKTVLLIIDEAHRLAGELLDEIRVLSNIDFNGSKLINIFLVGQNELRALLMEDRNRSLRQRISVNYHIEPLNESETAAVIEYRLKVAGATRSYFTTNAIKEIHAFSKGFPRLINVICDHAMLTGYSAGLTMLNAKIIRECAKELQIHDNSGDRSQYEKLQVKYRSPTQKLKEHEYLKKVKIPKKPSLLKIAGIACILTIFMGITIVFLKTSKNTQSINYVGYDEKIDSEKGLIENKKELAATVSDPERASVERPLKVRRSNGLIVAEDNETIEIHPKKSNSEKTEIKTNPTAPATFRSDQFLKHKPTGNKYLILDNSETPLVRWTNYSTKSGGKQLPSELLAQKISVFFKPDSTEIMSEDIETLAEIAGFISQDTNIRVIVEGYTDSYGNYFYNQKLSQLRANIVKSYLVAHGIDVSRISAIGLGSANPMADNENEEGRSQNRRVEIKLELMTKGGREKDRPPND